MCFEVQIALDGNAELAVDCGGVPIVHNATYEALRDVSPLLASRSGLDTAEDSMAVVAAKIAELVAG